MRQQRHDSEGYTWHASHAASNPK